MKLLAMSRHILINALMFQATWFIAIFGNVLLALPIAVFVVLHACKHFLSRPQILASALLVLIGILLDSLMAFAGIYQFQNEALRLVEEIIPVWLCLLWFAFVFTLKGAMNWALSRPMLYLVMSAIGGPLSYLAGRQAGVIQFDDVALVLIALEWMIFACVSWCLLKNKRTADITHPHVSHV